MKESLQTKSSFRAELRARRRRISAPVQREHALAIADLATRLPVWSEAMHIGLYHAADGEVATDILARRCREAGKLTYLPVVRAERGMVFAPLHEDTALRHNRFGIAEPEVTEDAVNAAALDIIFVPLVGWDRQGNRLGMGAGYYDRALAAVPRPFAAGLAHATQEAASLPRDSWDIPLNAVITEVELVLF